MARALVCCKHTQLCAMARVFSDSVALDRACSSCELHWEGEGTFDWADRECCAKTYTEDFSVTINGHTMSRDDYCSWCSESLEAPFHYTPLVLGHVHVTPDGNSALGTIECAEFCYNLKQGAENPIGLPENG